MLEMDPAGMMLAVSLEHLTPGVQQRWESSDQKNQEELERLTFLHIKIKKKECLISISLFALCVIQTGIVLNGTSSGLLFQHNCRAPNWQHPSAINCWGVGQIIRFYKPGSSRALAILMRCGGAVC